jgi:AbiV family abortive infection protein
METSKGNQLEKRFNWINLSRMSGKEKKIPFDLQLQGARLSALNVEQHYRIAEILSEAKMYGPARAHLILAVEEAIKTILVFGNILTGKETINDFSVVFNHQGRLFFAAIFGMVFGFVEQAREKLPSFKTEQEIRRWITQIERRAESGTAAFYKIMEWWGKAGVLRNDGFYVDYRSGSWRSPGRIGKAAYLNAKKKSELFIKIAIAMKDYSEKDFEEIRKMMKENEVDIHTNK